MPVRFEDVLEACNIVAKQEEINVCFTESLKGAGIAGLGAFILGIFLGPFGLAFGGAVGGIAASKMCKSYVPFWKVLMDMNEQDQVKLVNHMRSVIQGIDITDGIALIALVTNQDAVVRKLFLEGLMKFASQMST